jgi:type I restriction enzyme S subunit
MVNLYDLVECLDSRRIPVTENDRVEGKIPYYGANGQVGLINRAIFNEPLLLIAEDGGHFDDPIRGVAYTISGPSWVNNHAHVLRAKPDRVLLEYLGYYFRHFNFLPYITGSTRQKLNQKDLFKIDIPLPPLAEQERMVRILNEVEDMKRLRTQANNRAYDLIPALFDEMFGDPVRNEKGWSKIRLDSVAPLKSGYAFKSVDYQAKGIRLVRISNLDGNKVSFEDGAICVPDDYWKTSQAFRLSEGDVLIAMSGATTGKLGMVPAGLGRCLLNQRVGKFSINKDLLNNEYLYWLLKTKAINSAVITEASGFAQPNVSPDGVGKIVFPLPPISLQKDFAERVKEIRLLASDESSAEQRIESLFQSLLHSAFEGSL